MHHPWSCFAARLDRSPNNPVPYSKKALRQDLLRVQIAWQECQASRDRNAIYGYLSAVFDLVMWWAAEGRAVSRGCWALHLRGLDVPNSDEPFAAIIRCTADPAKVDKRTRSKWSRVLRYAMEYKQVAEPLAAFVQRKGGLTNVLTDLPGASGGAAKITYFEYCRVPYARRFVVPSKRDSRPSVLAKPNLVKRIWRLVPSCDFFI